MTIFGVYIPTILAIVLAILIVPSVMLIVVGLVAATCLFIGASMYALFLLCRAIGASILKFIHKE